jgi:peptide/nickel transport system substrate-binding protein
VALATLLAACGPAAAPPPAPTSAPKPAATTAPAAAPTTAATAAVAKPAATSAPAAAPASTVAAKPAATGGATVNAYLYQKPKVFSPLVAFNGPDQQIMSLIFDNLVIVNDQYAYEGRLAEKWDISSDGRTFTFTLRKGLKWSDGAPFTSKDVVFTYKLLANEASGSAQAAKFNNVKGIAEIRAGSDAPGFRAPDDSTFIIELDQPNAAYMATVAGPWFWVLPQHVLGSVPLADLNTHNFFLKPTAGMGPYSFVRYETDQFVELERNANYRTPVAIERMFLKPVTSDVATAQLEKGEMQLVQISATDIDRVRALPGVKVDSKPGPGIILMAVAQDQPHLQDKRVRQAVLHAIDRAGIVKQVLAGQAAITNTHILGPASALPADLNAYEYNPERARSLLQEAGWDTNRVVKIQWIKGQRDRDAAVEIAQAQLGSVGMKVELNPLEAGPLLENMKNRTFDFSLYGGGLYTVDPDSITVPTLCDQAYPKGGNNSHYCNKEVDALMQRGAATADQAERSRIYQQVAKITNDEVPYIWLYVPATVWAYSDKLQGIKPHGEFTTGFWNAAEWSLR